MEKLQLSLSQALNSDEFTILAKQRLINFKKASFKAIASTELIEESSVTEEPVKKETTRSRGRSNKKNLETVTSS